METASLPQPQLDSESGRLESLIIHSPGPEIESVTPDTAKELLYNDVIPLKAVQAEYQHLREFMSQICKVYEISDLLKLALANPRVSASAIEAVLTTQQIEGSKYEELSEYLHGLEPGELSDAIIHGVKKRSTSFEDHLSSSLYDLSPLPNFYFMRDAAMAYRESIVVGAMAHRVRRNEVVVQELIWNNLAKPETVVYSGFRHQRAWPGNDIRLEGGDFLVADKNLLLMGISQRTSAQAIDALVRSILNEYHKALDVLVVNLPKRRATIHLDMIFTYLDPETALVHEPLIAGPNAAFCAHGRFEPGREPRFSDYPSLLDALSAIKRPVKTVNCGGDDIHFQQREQWFAGTNVFAFAPGKIISYESNVATLEALSNAGYRIISISENESWETLADSPDFTAVTLPGFELARGGGGLRCMTMPLRRKPI